MAKKAGAPDTKALKDEVALYKLIEETANEVNLSVERTAQLQERASEAIQKGLAAGKTLSQIHDEILDTMEAQVAAAKETEKSEHRQQKAAEKKKKLKDEVLKAEETIKNLTEDTSNIMKAALKYDKSSAAVAHQELDLAKENLKARLASGQISRDDYNTQIGIVDQLHRSLSASMKLRESIGDEKAEALAEGFESAGGAVEKLTLGLVKSESVQNGLMSLTSKLGPGFIAALGPIMILVDLGKKLYDVMGEINAETQATADATGLSFSESEKLVKSSYEVAAAGGTILANQKDILASSTALVQEFGNTEILAGDTAANLADLSKAMGYSVQSGAKLQSILMNSGGASADAALGIQQAGASLAEAYGVPFDDVIQDIAESGEEVAKYFAGMPDDAVKTTVQLKAMGLSLKQASKMADSLLDIEASLKAETKAQIMLNKNINLDKARQLAAEGKIAEAAAEATKQIGSAAEFAKMDQFQKKAAAEAAGLTLEELSKTYIMQEKMANMSDEQKALAEKYGDKLGDISKLDKDQISAKLTALQGQEAMNASMENFQTAIKSALLPVMELIGPIFQGIGIVIDTLLVKPIGFVVGLIKSMGDYLSKNLDTLAVFGTTFLLILGYMKAAVIQEQLLAGIQLVKLGYQQAANAAALIYNGIQTAATAIATEGLLPYIARMAMAAFGAVASIPIVGPFIAPAAAAAALALGYNYMSKADDAVIPPVGEGGPGYSRVLSGPEGSIALNDKDSLIAGTDLGGGENAPAGGGGGSVDMSPLVAAVQQTNALLAQMINSPSPVLIGDEALRKIGRNVKVQNSRGA